MSRRGGRHHPPSALEVEYRARGLVRPSAAARALGVSVDALRAYEHLIGSTVFVWEGLEKHGYDPERLAELRERMRISGRSGGSDGV